MQRDDKGEKILIKKAYSGSESGLCRYRINLGCNPALILGIPGSIVLTLGQH